MLGASVGYYGGELLPTAGPPRNSALHSTPGNGPGPGSLCRTFDNMQPDAGQIVDLKVGHQHTLTSVHPRHLPLCCQATRASCWTTVLRSGRPCSVLCPVSMSAFTLGSWTR
jgi:hypothetical protein